MNQARSAVVVNGLLAPLFAAVVLAMPGFCQSARAQAKSASPQDSGGAAQPTEEEKVAAELKTGVEKLVEKYDALFQNPWLRYAKSNFGRAEQAVKSLIVDGKPNGAAINDFHYGLTVFARAMDSLPGWEPGNSGWADVVGKVGKRVDKPDTKQLKAMAKAVRELQGKANKVPTLQATERIKFVESTTAADAAEYGSRVMTTIERTLYEGTLEQITGEGKAKTSEVMKAPLDNLRAALAALDMQAGSEQDATAFAKSVATARERVAEVRKAGKELTRYHTWAEPRLKLVEPMLDGLDDNLKKLKAQKAH